MKPSFPPTTTNTSQGNGCVVGNGSKVIYRNMAVQQQAKPANRNGGKLPIGPGNHSIGDGNVVGDGAEVTFEDGKATTTPTCISVLCVIAKQHEFESAFAVSSLMDYETADAPADLRKVRRQVNGKTIEVTFKLFDHAGKDLIDKLSVETFREYDYLTTVGCCAGHPRLKLQTVIPFVQSFVNVRQQPKCDYSQGEGLDTAAKKYAERAKGHEVTELLFNPAKLQGNAVFVNQDKKLDDGFLVEPAVHTVSKVTELTQEGLEEKLDFFNALGLDMEIGYLWTKVHELRVSSKLKLKILPAFKGISDSGAPTEEESKRIREANRGPATKNASLAMFLYLEAHFLQ